MLTSDIQGKSDSNSSSGSSKLNNIIQWHSPVLERRASEMLVLFGRRSSFFLLTGYQDAHLTPGCKCLQVHDARRAGQQKKGETPRGKNAIVWTSHRLLATKHSQTTLIEPPAGWGSREGIIEIKKGNIGSGTMHRVQHRISSGVSPLESGSF